jgi:hypothetical protein
MTSHQCTNYSFVVTSLGQLFLVDATEHLVYKQKKLLPEMQQVSTSK